MKKSILRDKSFQFAINVITSCRSIQENQKEYILSSQLLRCGTGIGANIREAIFAESRKDFIHKLSIAQKETSETIYWLELLGTTEYLDKKSYEDLLNKATIIIKLLTASIKTAKNSNH